VVVRRRKVEAVGEKIELRTSGYSPSIDGDTWERKRGGVSGTIADTGYVDH